MRKFTEIFCPTFSTQRRVAAAIAMGAALTVAQAFAEPEARPLNQRSPASGNLAAEPGGLSECLLKLKLSPKQETQTLEVIHNYDAKLDIVWKQFGNKYLETVRTEVALLAAVEDNLTEPQRAKVREQRRKVAHAEQALEGTKTKPNSATAKPADAVAAVEAVDHDEAGIKLTSEQEAIAEKIHHQHAAHVRSLNRDIQGLHNRLVSLEADKLVEIEKLLTPEQLIQLREGRQSMAAAQKVTSTEKATK